MIEVTLSFTKRQIESFMEDIEVRASWNGTYTNAQLENKVKLHAALLDIAYQEVELKEARTAAFYREKEAEERKKREAEENANRNEVHPGSSEGLAE